MKKILLASLLLSCVTFAKPYDEEGWRWGVGARAGVAAFTGKLNTTSTVNQIAPATANITQHVGSFDAGITSFQGGAFIEGAYRWCDWSLGALVDVNGDTMNQQYASIVNTTFGTPNRIDTLNTTLKSPVHVGGDLRGGMYFGDALWYVLIGGEAIRYEFIHNIIQQTNPFSVALPATLSVDQKFWRGALRVGTGIECCLAENVKLKLEYRFLWAGKRTMPIASVNQQGSGDFAANTYQLAVADVVTFRQHVTALMLSYEF